MVQCNHVDGCKLAAFDELMARIKELEAVIDWMRGENAKLHNQLDRFVVAPQSGENDAKKAE